MLKRQLSPFSRSGLGETWRQLCFLWNCDLAIRDWPSAPERIKGSRKWRCGSERNCSPAWKLTRFAALAAVAIARASSNSFFSTFVLASMLRDDPRFYPQSHPTFGGSIKYAATRLFVTRTDAGNETVNLPRLIGPLGAETLANVYLPRSEQTGAKTAQRYGTDLAWNFASNMFKNYWPTIFHRLGLNKLKVVPDPGTNH